MPAKNEYDRWHSEHAGDSDMHAPWHRFVLGHIEAEVLRDAHVLEIGCGRGGFTDQLIKKFPDVATLTACDYSEAALEIAASNFGSANGKIVWKKADITAISFPDNTFDVVVSCETIEHVRESSTAVKELYRVLRPGGRLFLTCPNYFNFFGLWCLYRLIIGKPFTEGGQPYVHYLQMPLVYLWLKKAGFRVDKYFSSDLIMPARVPRHFYDNRTPLLLTFFGYRTYYVAIKKSPGE
jgi:SAM-dependent methyltransferase